MVEESTARTAFVVSPIGSPGTPEHRRSLLTLTYIVKKALPEPAWKVVRADEESAPDSITAQVVGRIVESDLIVADLTDHNPNVFYELAVAHGYGKNVIHLLQKGQNVPFDVVDQRVIFYDLTDPESVDSAVRGVTSAQAWLDENPGQARNPISSFGQFKAIAAGASEGDVGSAVAEALSSLSRQVRRLEARIPDPIAPGMVQSERAKTQALLRSVERRIELIRNQEADRADDFDMDLLIAERDRLLRSLEWSMDQH